MKRKHTYLLVCLALVGALVLTSVALGDKGSGSSGNGDTRPSTARTGTRRLTGAITAGIAITRGITLPRRSSRAP